ncbi:hypothetical protein L208DRAFT_1387759, partial [Tricholoma matsutake]
MPKRRTRAQTPRWGLHNPSLITGDIYDDGVQDYDTRYDHDDPDVATALRAVRDLWAGEDLSDPEDDEDSLAMQEALNYAISGDIALTVTGSELAMT